MKSSPRLLNMSLQVNRYLFKSGLLLCNQARLGYSLKLTRNLSTNSLLDNADVQKYLRLIEAEYNSHRNDSKANLNQSVMDILDKRKIIESDLKSVLKMPCDNDNELKKLVLEEKNKYVNDINNLNSGLVNLLTPEFYVDRSVIVEVTPGVGGGEAMLFAREIYDMYNNFSVYKNWTWFDMDKDFTEIGGLKKASALVSGKSVYEYLIQEAGIHRVQRVPHTETKGRTHTSTCSVSIIPQPTDAEVVIKQSDITITKKNSSGAGGQNVNKRETCIRLIHEPTGIIIEAQSERTSERNREIALQKLKSKLYSMQLEEESKKREKTVKSQVGLKLRSDKIRTYQFVQNRVTDHRIKQDCHNLPVFLLGGKELDEMISQLIVYDRRERFLQHVSEKLQSEFYVNLMKAEVSQK